MTGHLVFEEVHRSRHQLVLNYRIDDIRFSTVYWYDTVNFYELEARFGQAFMTWIYFHLLAFESNKAASLKPAILDLGPYREFYTDRFAELWNTIFFNVWGVWRYENDIVDYKGPQVLALQRSAQNHVVESVKLDAGEKLLELCGGGKDSLASAKRLERAGLQYDAMVYSHNICQCSCVGQSPRLLITHPHPPRHNEP